MRTAAGAADTDEPARRRRQRRRGGRRRAARLRRGEAAARRGAPPRRAQPMASPMASRSQPTARPRPRRPPAARGSRSRKTWSPTRQEARGLREHPARGSRASPSSRSTGPTSNALNNARLSANAALLRRPHAGRACAVDLTGAGEGFVAGADISELASETHPPRAPPCAGSG
jgi:hypothetical protein